MTELAQLAGGPMLFRDYYVQEPPSETARSYHTEVMRRGAALSGNEMRYGADPYQSVVIFRTPAPNTPILAFLHGGGWTNGYKESMSFMAPALTAAGVTFASVGYRLAPGYIFPVGFDDACTGVKLLLDSAAGFGANSDRLFVGGHSAGGHYAALMALTRPDLKIRGCLPVSGVYDFGPHSGLITRPRFLGTPDADRDVAVSPIEQIPATLLARSAALTILASASLDILRFRRTGFPPSSW